MSDVRPFVSVIVPARDAEKTIAECIESLVCTDYPLTHREIIVVDNDSADGTAEIIQRYPVRYVWEGRRGPSHARNRGIEESSGEILAFTDADCVVATGWLRELVGSFSDEDIEAAAGEIYAYPPTTPVEQYIAWIWRHQQQESLASPRPFVVTSNVAFRRNVFDRIGLFDPTLLTAEDQEFSWRFFDLGHKLEYRPGAVVLHRHRSTAWGMFRQQYDWGCGLAILNIRYARMGFENYKVNSEIRASVRVTALAKSLASRTLGKSEIYYLYFDLLRMLGFRIGLIRGSLEASRLRRQARG
jgi:glycosyltransferase involved in cell wall biosynthesis